MIHKENQKGQSLITILFFMLISITIITAISSIILNSTSSGSSIEQGSVAYYSAESGVQNAILRLLRDPNYTGETMSINDGTVTIVVSGGLITSTAHVANSIRKIQVQTGYTNNVLTISSWKETN